MFSRPPRRLALDAAIGAFLFVTSLLIGGWYVPHFVKAGGKPWFYQEEFGPAVMLACGHGYMNPDVAAAPALDAFLHRERDSVSCSELGAVKVLPFGSMQRAFRYLISTVGWTWQVQGHVSWSAVTPLYALLYGVTVVLAFAIFRQGMGPIASALCGLAIAVSTLHLNNLPHLRDYGKAPFVLALVLVALRLVLPAFSARRTLMLAALAGLLTGVGVGFRNDLLVAIPAFIALFALFLPVGWRDAIGVRAAAAAVYVASVMLAMYPMWSTYTTGGGSSTQHLVLLGLTPAFGHDLGVDNSRLYEWGFEYRDELALAMIDNYADRRDGRHAFLEMYGPDYDRAGSRYLLEVAQLFPADLLARVYASAVGVMSLPHSDTTSALMAPAYAPDWWRRWSDVRARRLRAVAPYWPWAFAITFAATSLASVRLGLFAAALVLYLSGYPALQFQERHFFHLEFIAWFALGFSASLAVRVTLALTSASRRAALAAEMRPAAGWRRSTATALAFWCAAALVTVGPLWLLRRYQAPRVRALLTSIVQAPRDRVDVTRSSSADGALHLEASSLAQEQPSDDGVHAAYVEAELGGAACDALQIDLTERYRGTPRGYDFTHAVRVAVPLSDAPVRVVFPAYFRHSPDAAAAGEEFAFGGLDLPPASAACVLNVAAIRNPEAIPLLLDLQLPPHWESVTPFATISGVESRSNPPAVYANPADLPRTIVKRALASRTTAFTEDDLAKRSKTLARDGGGWRVDGAGGVGGRGPLLYLAEMKPRRLARGSFLIAEGELAKGGVTFGLVRGVDWVTAIHVKQTGHFTVVARVPQDDEYKVVFANNLLGLSSLTNRVAVARLGLAAPLDEAHTNHDAASR